MSRCFPYPPPGYVKNGIRDEALIESIKLQREGEKAKKERKKEKKRLKKEKEKVKENGGDESKKHRHKKRGRDEKGQEYQKGGAIQKVIDGVTDQHEKSTLTEEHGLLGGSQNSSSSSLNSNKRQKLNASPDCRHSNSGSIIRIRLPTQRHKDPEVLPSKESPLSASVRSDDVSVQRKHKPSPAPSREQVEHPWSSSRNMGLETKVLPSKEQPITATVRIDDTSFQRKEKTYSASGREQVEHPWSSAGNTGPELKGLPIKEKLISASLKIDDGSVQRKHTPSPALGGEHVEETCSTSRNTVSELDLRLENGNPCLSSGAAEITDQRSIPTLPRNICGICPPKIASKLKTLVENWVPPEMQNVFSDSGDLDWLRSSKQKQTENYKTTCYDMDSGPSSGIFDPWPRSCHLPEADIYALPFTIPF